MKKLLLLFVFLLAVACSTQHINKDKLSEGDVFLFSNNWKAPCDKLCMDKVRIIEFKGDCTIYKDDGDGIKTMNTCEFRKHIRPYSEKYYNDYQCGKHKKY